MTTPSSTPRQRHRRIAGLIALAATLLVAGGCAAWQAIGTAAGTAGAVVGGAGRATRTVANQTVDAMSGASAPASAAR